MRFRRRATLALLLAATAAGGFGWLLLRPAPNASQRDAPAVAAQPAASSLAPAIRSELAPTARGAASAPVAAPASRAAAHEARATDVEIEICGVGRVSKRQFNSSNPIEQGRLMAQLHLLDQRKDAAMSRLSARLAAGSDRERVAARLLMDDPEGAALAAQRSTDATAYRLALAGCGRAADAPGCRALTVQAWARLDPEDARPWLQLMAEAALRQDDAAAAQALEQVLQRSKLSPTRILLPTVTGAYAAVEDAVGLGLAAVDVIGREAAFPQVSGLGLKLHCGAVLVKDPSRRARCERLALWQFRHVDSVLDGLMAVALADRVGLPAEQRPYTRDQLNQGLRLLADASRQVGDLDCRGLARTADWSARLSQRSELQQALQAAGEP